MRKKAIDGVNRLIKTMVDWQVKRWCSDIDGGGSLSWVGGMTALAAADHMAYEIGDPNGEWIQDFRVSAHVRSYRDLMKYDSESRNNHIDWDLINIFGAEDDDYRKIAGIDTNTINYLRSPEGEDSLILFLMRSPHPIIEEKAIDAFKDKSAADGPVIGKHEETDEERKARMSCGEIEEDDWQLRNGRIIAAVELTASKYGKKFGENGEVHDWREARDLYARCIIDGETELGAYKKLSNTCLGWSITGIEDVSRLFFQYAQRSTGDFRFMEMLTNGLPKFAVFKTSEDAEAAEEAVKNGKKIDYSTMLEL